MNIPDLPCIETKCMLLPVCKNKQFIECEILYNFIHCIYRKYANYNFSKHKINIQAFRDYIHLLMNKHIRKLLIKVEWILKDGISDIDDVPPVYIFDHDINNCVKEVYESIISEDFKNI